MCVCVCVQPPPLPPPRIKCADFSTPDPGDKKKLECELLLLLVVVGASSDKAAGGASRPYLARARPVECCAVVGRGASRGEGAKTNKIRRAKASKLSLFALWRRRLYCLYCVVCVCVHVCAFRQTRTQITAPKTIKKNTRRPTRGKKALATAAPAAAVAAGAQNSLSLRSKEC